MMGGIGMGKGFADIFADLFKENDTDQSMGLGVMLAAEKLKRALAQASSPEEAEEILKSVPKALRKKLGFKVKKLRKSPEHIFSEARIAGEETRARHLQGAVKAYYLSERASRKKNKMLRKVQLQNEKTIGELRESVDQLKHQVAQANRDADAARRHERNLRQGIEDLRGIVRTKDQELAAVAPIVTLARNMRELIKNVNVSESRTHFLETITALQAIVADPILDSVVATGQDQPQKGAAAVQVDHDELSKVITG